MRRLLVRPFLLAATLLGVLFLAVLSSVSVGAAPPQLFTRNGCAVGNYACLRAMGVRFVPPRAYVAPYIAPNYLPAYGAMPYGPNYTAMPSPASGYGSSGSATATIMTGRVASTGQQVTASIDGFSAGEMVTASITAPNGQVMQVGSAAAAADGSVTIMVTFPSAGTWQVTAHGQSSNKTVVDAFTVH